MDFPKNIGVFKESFDSVVYTPQGLKSQLSSVLRKYFKWLSKVYWKENVVWSPGYFVSSIGVEKEIIKRYVEYQGQQDSGQLRMKL